MCASCLAGRRRSCLGVQAWVDGKKAEEEAAEELDAVLQAAKTVHVAAEAALKVAKEVHRAARAATHDAGKLLEDPPPPVSHRRSPSSDVTVVTDH